MKLILEVARNIPGAWVENVTPNMINFFERNCHPMKHQDNQFQDIIFWERGTLGLQSHLLWLRGALATLGCQ